MDESDDLTIWKYAKEHNFHIVSQDSDFNALNTLYGYPPKIVWIHAGNRTTDMIIELIQKKYEVIRAFLDNDNTGLLELD